MSYCDACGTPRREGQAFCTGCGKAFEAGGAAAASPYVEPTPAGTEATPAPPAPPLPASGQPTAEFPAPPGDAVGVPPDAPPQRAAGVALPSWLVTDWPVVGICVLLIALVTVVVSAVYGAVVALAASGGDAVISGAITGAYLAFSAFGAASGAFRATEDSVVQVATSFLPLPGVLVPVIAAWLALGFGYPRVAPQRAARLAFVAKVAVVFGILAGIMASVLSLGEFESESGSGDLVSRVSAGSVAFYAMLILGLTGLVYLVRRGDMRSLSTRVSQPARTSVLMEGAKAFVLVVAVMAAVALVAALVAADSMTERLVVLLAIPFLVVNVGIAGAALAMGGAVGLGEAPSEDTEFVAGVITDHVSLFHWGFPPGADPGSAPPYLFVLLALAPAAAGWMAYRCLQRRPARTEQDLWSVGFLVALGFAVASFVGALFGRILLSAFTDDFERGGILFARPSVAAALGLGLLWGIVGGLGGALLWGQRQGMTVISRAAPSTPEAAPATPPFASQSTACPRCGSPAAAGARFCEACGTALT